MRCIFIAICTPTAAEIHCNVGHDGSTAARAIPRCGELSESSESQESEGNGVWTFWEGPVTSGAVFGNLWGRKWPGKFRQGGFRKVSGSLASLSRTLKSRTKKQPKDEVFAPDIPRTSGGHLCGYPVSKLRSGPSKLWENKHFGVDIHDLTAQMSTTLRDFQKLRSEKLWAEFLFPIKST